MTDTLDLGPRPIEGGYFLRHRMDQPEPFISLSREADATEGSGRDGPWRHCFTYWDSERTIRQEVLDMVAKAERKVFVASFLIGDDEFHGALVDAARRLVGGVYVITQVDERRLRKGLADLGEEPGAGLQAQKKRFDQMTTQGIYVRGHPSCHAKFVVVDDETALVSSANLMTDAFDRTGENGVVVTDRDEAKRLAHLFTRLWHQRCPREALPGRAYSLKSVTRGPDAGHRQDKVPQPVLDGRPEIIWTDGDDGERHILATIHDVVDGAEHELLLATFSLVGMREHRQLLLDHVVEALKRGVHVRMLVRPRRNNADHVADIAALARAGVQVYGDVRTHMKGVIADGRLGTLFSANFDSEHGLTTGVEAGVRLDGTPALDEADSLFRHALANATLQYRIEPTHEELSGHLDVQGRVPWPLARTLTVDVTPENRSHFVEAAVRGPVLFTEPKNNRITLHADRTDWHLITDHPDRPHRLRPAGTENHQSTTSLLQAWLTQDQAPPRGICPATFRWT